LAISAQGNTMKKTCLILCLVSCSAFADDSGLIRCSGIVEASARLACYDALAGKAKAAVPGAPSAAAPAATTPVAAPALVQNAAAPTPVQDTVQQFGLEQRQPKGQLQTIESTIPGHFEGWEPRSLITLANGQVWRVMELGGHYMYVDNPHVVIRRGLLGVFYMDFDKDNHSPRVQRVR